MTSTNKLAGETSPYLLQHADNPVHWLPWGPEALELARSEDRPILLSVGYSACHWCHVMAHESFEHPATAELMNQLFVNIKVDREERPDLDRIYQLAHQLLTRRPGGWPLTVFLTADDHTPFFAGTYFPREPRHGMPAFAQVLQAIADHYADKREEIDTQRVPLLEALASMEPGAPASERLSSRPLSDGRRELERSFDPTHGGFGNAPKFPHPSNLQRLLRHYAGSSVESRPDDGALAMATTTLTRMAQGGIYDQLAGGFCRYAVDGQWMIPHFEKMLYDNGPLLELCAWAWQLTGNDLFARTATGTARWVMNEMQGEDGGYYSSLDADSEGEEGKYYVWQPQEVRELLDGDEFDCISRHFGLDRPPNFEGHAWHLHTFVDVPELAEERDEDEATVRARIETAQRKLLARRATRVRPGLDDKVLAAWNALMIRGMCAAARVFGDDALLRSAERAMDYVQTTLFVDGRLLATARGGRAHLDAYLDDHALLVDACLALLQCRWRRQDLDFAIDLAEILLQRFQDTQRGGFFFTAHDHETLIHRPRPMMDDALPAGNAVAALALGRLGHLLGEPRYIDAAEHTVRAGWSGLCQYPHAHAALGDALEELLYPPQTIIIRGDPATAMAWKKLAQAHYHPRRLCVAIPGEEESLPGLLAVRQAREGTTAYICRGHQCDAPVSDEREFRAALGEAVDARAAAP